ncbi:MAG: hypothetical protein M3333_02910 [Actinomycetota bacterium]|nr:hypothetical protein [Actinomycetota bacterium]
MGSEPAPAGTDAFGLPAELRFSGVVAVSWRLYRSHGPALFRLYVAIFLPLAIVRVGIQVLLSATTSAVAAQVILTLTSVVLVALAGSFALHCATVILADGVSGRGTSPRAAARSLRGRLKDLMSAGLLVGMLSIVALFLPFGPLGSVVIVPMLLGPPILAHVIAVEARSFPEAFARARMLLGGNWGRVLVTLLNIAFVLGILQLVLLSSAVALLAGAGGLALLLLTLFQTLIAALALPYLAAAAFVTYLDLRVRNEDLGWAGLAAERTASQMA